MYFQTRCCLNFFLPYGPMLTKTKQIWQKSKFFAVNLLCTFRHDNRLKFFLPYGPMLTKTKKNRKKIKNAKVSEKTGFTDGRPHDDSSSAVQ